MGRVSAVANDLSRADLYGRLRNRIEARMNAASATKEFPGLYEWGSNFFPHYHQQAPGKHHLILSQELAAPVRGAHRLLVAPRESAKSTYISFDDILYDVCHKREKYIILIADTFEQAKKYLQGIQYELEHNEKLASTYPEACGRGSEWGDRGILTRNGIRIEPLGTGQKIRGRREHQNRPTKIVIDDPQGDEAAYSSVTREHDWDWFTKGVLKAGSEDTNLHVGATIIHRECIAGKLLVTPGWKIFNFKAIEVWPLNMQLWAEWESILCDGKNVRREEDAQAFYTKHKEAMHEGAEVLWEAREPLYSLMFKRAVGGHTAFESEKQNNPIDPSKCEWTPDLFEGDVWFDEWPANSEVRTFAMDPSKGATDKPGDYCAMVSVAKSGPLFYVDADLRRISTGEILDRYEERVIDFKPDLNGIETNQMQHLFLEQVVDRFVTKGLNVPVPIENTVNKDVRIRRLGGYFSQRMIRFKRRSAGVQKLVEQLMDFPNGDYDDGPDALEMAMRLVGYALQGSTMNDSETASQGFVTFPAV